MDAVVFGRFKMVMGGKQFIVEAGDILAVPRRTLHSTEVRTGDRGVRLDGVQVEASIAFAYRKPEALQVLMHRHIFEKRAEIRIGFGGRMHRR